MCNTNQAYLQDLAIIIPEYQYVYLGTSEDRVFSAQHKAGGLEEETSGGIEEKISQKSWYDHL